MRFINRDNEQVLLTEINSKNEAAIIIIFGRRRVGKTALIEHAFKNRHLVKFEGLEGKEEAQQRQHVLKKISEHWNNPMYEKLRNETWLEIFELLADLTRSGEWTLYFEEVQWLADYANDFIGELKHAWDNQFRHNSKLRLILCGSAPSFMINNVVHSKALYNRSQYEIHLQPFNLSETQVLLGRRSQREIMDAYLSIGGIPEYLNKIKSESSLYLGLCKHAFSEHGFLVNEYQKIFISSLATSKHYEDIIEFLSKKKYATRQEIAKHIGITAGGTLSNLLDDLQLCGFIEIYQSYHLPNSGYLSRYAIADNYLRFYFKFIKPIKKKILLGQFNQNPTAAIRQETYYKWLGYAFEHYCRNNYFKIAERLGFGAVDYICGPYFTKNSGKTHPGFQIDLLFDRSDKVITICEIKYLQRKVGLEIIEEFERKLMLFPKTSKSIHKVLITASGATDALINRHYFDVILTLDDLV